MMQVFYTLPEAKRYAKRIAKETGKSFHIFKTLGGTLAGRLGYEYSAMSFDDPLMPECFARLETVTTIKGA